MQGFGSVSRLERKQADLFLADLGGQARSPGLRLPPPVEHDVAGARVLQAGLVAPRVDGTRNLAHVAIVSPSNPLAGANQAATLAPLIGNFQARFAAAGHRVSLDFAQNEPSPPFRDESDHRYAGTDAQRSAALLSGLFDAGSTAVVASAGGHGATRLLDELAARVASALAQQAPRVWPRRPRAREVFTPKRVVGFSDFTAVLLASYSLLGWAGIHGPMLCCTGGGASLDRLVRALTRDPGDLDPGNVVDGNLTLVGPAPAGPVRGVLLGGNLSLVETLYGSPFFPSLQGGILFIEELNEEGRKVDRMIEGLKQRGAAAQARAVVVGQVIGGGSVGAREVATLIQRSWNLPCAFGLRAGHDTPNRALWIGLEYELQFPRAGRASLLLRPPPP